MLDFFSVNNTFGSTIPKTTVTSQINTEAVIHVKKPSIRNPEVKIDVSNSEAKVVISAIKLDRLGAYFDVSFEMTGASNI